MESNLKHGNRWKKEKGLTLIETVVALSIISIVSLAVVTITVYSSNALNEARVKSFFSRETNTMATFYLSYDDTDFKAAVYSMTGNTIVGDNTDRVYYKNDYSYSNSSDYMFYMSFNYEDETLTLNSYNKDNKLQFTRSITR